MRASTLLAVLGLAAFAYGEDLYSLAPQGGFEAFSIPAKLMPGFGKGAGIGGNPTGPIRSGSTCVSETLLYCRNAFNTALNISSNIDWTNPQALHYAINKIYNRGIDAGVLPLCQARSQFYACLGTAYPTCVSRINLVGHGTSDQNAILYVQIMKRLEFECDAGSIQTMQSYDCIQAVRKSPDYNATYQTCINVYNNLTHHGTNAKNFCIAGQGLVECISPLFDKCHHNNHDVQWWECELIRTSFQMDDYCPNSNCVYAATGDAKNGKNVASRGSKAAMIKESFDMSGRANLYHRAVHHAGARMRA